VIGLLLGIDLGTSSVKAALYRPDGSLVAESGASYPTQRRGAEEQQDPEEWLQAARTALAAVLPYGRPTAMAVTGQMSGLLLLDAQDRPLMPFLPWSDRRAEAEAGWLAERFGSTKLYRATGCRAVGSYPAAKLRWTRTSRPDLWAGVRRVAGAREYLMYRLTGLWVTDPSCAGATQLFDLGRQTWWQPVMDALGVEAAWLPELRLPWEPAGLTVSEALGLPAGIPVAAGSGDGACSSLGVGAREPGDAVISIGTSGVVRVLDQQPLIHPLAATTCYPIGPGLYAGTGVTSAAGAALEWTARLLGLGGVQDLERLAEDSPGGAAGVAFVPSMGGARTPTWDPTARGAFVGLDLSHTRAHVARATIEGVALSLARAMEALREAGAHPRRVLLTGGGSQSRLLSATLANLTGLPTFVSAGGDATLGAAQLAAVASGLYPDLEAARSALAPRLLPVEPEALPPGLLERYIVQSEATSPRRG
jgi:xylulokinase